MAYRRSHVRSQSIGLPLAILRPVQVAEHDVIRHGDARATVERDRVGAWRDREGEEARLRTDIVVGGTAGVVSDGMKIETATLRV